MRHKQITKITLQYLQNQLEQYLHRFSIEQFRKSNQLKYDPTVTINNILPIVQPLITYLVLIKFPLLLSLANRSEILASLDKEVKRVYQSLITKLVNQFHFEHFIFVVVKWAKNFIQTLFQEIQIVPEDERQMYCVTIKILLGLMVHEQAYTLLQKKFTDKQKYEQCPLIISKKRQSRQKGSKKEISMNLIQAKLERRKMHRFKTSQRNSISITHRNQEIQEFKQNLMKQLRVINEADKQLTKIKYAALQQQNSQEMRHQKYIINTAPRKNIIQTQQISASLELSLNMKKCKHSYTKRNIAIKLTDVTQRLSHPLFQPTYLQTQLEGGDAIAKKDKTVGLNKKTKTYWKKMANKMKEINNSFQY